jgi:hypothetical protein
MIIIIPILIGLILHIIIFNHVRSSTRRVQPSAQTPENDANNQQQQRTNHRDSQLIRRMIIMFGILVVGWSPLHIYTIIIPDFSITLPLSSCFTLLAQLCLLINIINLYLYNHQLRKYLQNLIFKCSHLEQ